MIAVSGVIYRIFANVLKDLVTDWCVKKGKIPDTQFGFFPGGSTVGKEWAVISTALF